MAKTNETTSAAADTTTSAADATIQPTDATIGAVDAAAVSPTSSIPQVGDVTARGVIAGVRRYAGGVVEISFNGSDFEPL